jgi:hypothetical protein
LLLVFLLLFLLLLVLVLVVVVVVVFVVVKEVMTAVMMAVSAACAEEGVREIRDSAINYDTVPQGGEGSLAIYRDCGVATILLWCDVCASGNGTHLAA